MAQQGFPRCRQPGPQDLRTALQPPGARHAERGAALHQAQQYRFRLIVPMVPQQQQVIALEQIFEDRVPRRARLRLPTALRSGAPAHETDPESAAEPGAMALPASGIGVQPVIDVHGGDIGVDGPADVQEHGGVQPPGETDEEPPVGELRNL